MDKNRTFHELIEITRRVVKEFNAVEQRPWSVEATVIELVKQVGDLARRVMTIERYYLPDRSNNPVYQTSQEDIGDELADILYSVVRVADYYQVDLEKAHLEARRKELRYLNKEVDF